MSNGRIAIVGLGNMLMGDDGVGVAALEMIRKQALPDSVDIVDAGTAISDVLPSLAEHELLIVVDAVRGGGAPGEIHRFDLTPERLGDTGMPFSLHELNLVEAIRLQLLAGQPIPPIRVIGVEPRTIAPKMELSDDVRASLESVACLVAQEIQQATNKPGG